MLKYLYITLGMTTLCLGLLGIVTPGLPTTPLLLLTAFLFAKSSPKLHQRLLDNKLTGRYIRKVNEGLSLKSLLFSIGFMWIMVCFSAFIVFGDGKMRFILLGLGVIGTIAQIIVLGNKKRKTNKISPENKDNSKPNRFY